MKKNIHKYLKPTLIAIDIAAILLLTCALSTMAIDDKALKLSQKIKVYPYNNSISGNNQIYFLNTGTSDCIIIYSNGHIAIIDSGEPKNNPYYQDYVLKFIRNHFKDENNQIHIDMIVGTHSHRDHIAGFDSIIMDDQTIIDKAYLRVYNADNITLFERNKYDNQQVYDQMIDAIKLNDIPLIQDINEEPFTFGDFTMQFINTYIEPGAIVGENENSLGLLLTINNQKIFLASDINNHDGDEDRIKDQIGKVDVLKMGHHGYSGSSTYKFVETLKPELAIVTNRFGSITQFTKLKYTILGIPILSTVNNDGIMLNFNDNGFDIYTNIKY